MQWNNHEIISISDYQNTEKLLLSTLAILTLSEKLCLAEIGPNFVGQSVIIKNAILITNLKFLILKYLHKFEFDKHDAISWLNLNFMKFSNTLYLLFM